MVPNALVYFRCRWSLNIKMHSVTGIYIWKYICDKLMLPLKAVMCCVLLWVNCVTKLNKKEKRKSDRETDRKREETWIKIRFNWNTGIKFIQRIKMHVTWIPLSKTQKKKKRKSYFYAKIYTFSINIKSHSITKWKWMILKDLIALRYLQSASP